MLGKSDGIESESILALFDKNLIIFIWQKYIFKRILQTTYMHYRVFTYYIHALTHKKTFFLCTFLCVFRLIRLDA